MDRIDHLAAHPPAVDTPVCLYDAPDHKVYWVGSAEPSPFRCNAYLVIDGDHAILLDPGSASHHFAQVRDRVATLMPPERVSHIVAHHQDADVIGSLPRWLELNPELVVVTTPRTRVLLPYFGLPDEVNWLDVSPNDTTLLELPSGKVLAFFTAPFLHFPEACVTFDETTGFLFTGDVGAAIEKDWELVVTDWERHWRTMVPFHVFYMASNRALAGFVEKMRPFPIQAILPQHGSVIPQRFVGDALDALAGLPCGIDLLYPEGNLETAMKRLLR